jgi:hypothetical protein
MQRGDYAGNFAATRAIVTFSRRTLPPEIHHYTEILIFTTVPTFDLIEYFLKQYLWFIWSCGIVF